MSQKYFRCLLLLVCAFVLFIPYAHAAQGTDSVPDSPEKIAKMMQKIRYDIARNKLLIELSKNCRNCETCRCRKDYEYGSRRIFTVQGRSWKSTKRLESCVHRMEGEIEYFDKAYKDKVEVRYELPAGIDRMKAVNLAIGRYNRENKDLQKRYKKLEEKLRKHGASYEDFQLNDKADTAWVIPAGEQ